MRYFNVICSIVIAMCSFAQQIDFVNIKLDPHSTKATMNKRFTEDGKGCAIIRVNVVGEDNLTFNPAVGDVFYNLNQYEVYVPDGINYFEICKNGNTILNVDLDDEVTIESLRVYDMVLTTNKGAVIFYTTPSDAIVKVDGTIIKTTQEGLYSDEMSIGEHDYTITADGYLPQTGSFNVSKEEPIKQFSINLLKETFPVKFHTLIDSASVFIDDIPYGLVSDNIRLTKGSHEYRVICQGYNEEKGTIEVKEDKNIQVFPVNLKEKKTKTFYHSEEKTKTSGNLPVMMPVAVSAHTTFEKPWRATTGRFDIDVIKPFGHVLALKAGLNFGVTVTKDSVLSKKLDDYYESIEQEKENSGVSPFYLGIPLQVGIILPIEKFNRSQIAIFGGVYGSLYYKSYSDKKEDGSYSVHNSTTTYDYGLRANVLFFIRKFYFGVEYNQSFKKILPNTLGVNIGYLKKF